MRGLAAIGVLCSGCALGVGVIEPGTHRVSRQDFAQTEVKSLFNVGGTVVAITETGPIRRIEQHGEQQFVGFFFGVTGGPGALRIGDYRSPTFNAEMYGELVAGQGRFAGGLRLSAMARGGSRRQAWIDVDGDGQYDVHLGVATSFLPTLTLHYGVTPRWTVHGGLGYDLFTFTDTRTSFRALVGTRVAILSGDRGAMLLLVELDRVSHQDDAGPYVSTGALGGLAFIF